jgi:hypothetical protein
LEHGVFAELEDRGYSVFVARAPLNEIMYGSWRLSRVSEVHEIITIVPSIGSSSSYELNLGSRLVASWDPLSPLERIRAGELEAMIRTTARGRLPEGPLLLDNRDTFGELERDGASRSNLDELLDLQQRGDRYFIYLSPAGLRSGR